MLKKNINQKKDDTQNIIDQAIKKQRKKKQSYIQQTNLPSRQRESRSGNSQDYAQPTSYLDSRRLTGPSINVTQYVPKRQIQYNFEQL